MLWNSEERIEKMREDNPNINKFINVKWIVKRNSIIIFLERGDETLLTKMILGSNFEF